MIIDALDNAGLYAGIGTRLRTALEALANRDFTESPPGRVEIDGDDVFALVQDYETRTRTPADPWEAHRRYIDVQYIAAGTETMGFAPVNELRERQPYDPDKDCALYSGDGDFVTVRRGMFVVFFPWDAHLPGLAAPDPAGVRKVVVKVALRKGETS